MFQFNIRHLARTWAGRRKKNWYENQKLPLKGISRIQRRDIDKVLEPVSNPESRERKRIDETPSRGGGGEGGGVFFAPPIGKFHLIWKVSDCSNGRVAELPPPCGERMLAFNKARILSSIVEGRNSVSFRREARKLSSPSKKLFFCSADRGFFFDNLSRGWGGMPREIH